MSCNYFRDAVSKISDQVVARAKYIVVVNLSEIFHSSPNFAYSRLVDFYVTSHNESYVPRKFVNISLKRRNIITNLSSKFASFCSLRKIFFPSLPSKKEIL